MIKPVEILTKEIFRLQEEINHHKKMIKTWSEYPNWILAVTMREKEVKKAELDIFFLEYAIQQIK